MSKKELVAKILKNDTYMPGSGMYADLKKQLLRLPKNSLLNLAILLNK